MGNAVTDDVIMTEIQLNSLFLHDHIKISRVILLTMKY